ncbi:hypothetical protein M433DRAFT_150160 [Acidomyces richmondensis BFW]|nr:MAG: hypothetical protein FE78DRAFT_94142 [Acidomyces sp. 'richmondensis']KYG49295.1 hypothetical protein M433DRAFT_150160 [Acidomyces richmondensis BFW]
MDLVNHLHDRLLFAVPKKGRLQQATLDLLAGSDIKFHRHNRLDLALVMNLPLALVFLPAADIPEFVAEGRVDLGITGRDTVAEYQASNNANNNTSDTTIGIDEIMDLEFGRCKLQVQVPKGSIRDPKELVGKRIATSFTGLAEAYFRQLEAEVEESLPNVLTNGASSGELPKKKLLTNIRPLSGSVEAACALGLADGIVDLVESGETMRAAGLEAIATVVESTAVLVRSKQPSNPKLVSIIAARIRGVITAQKYVLCTYNVERALLPEAAKITPGKRAPTVTNLEDPQWVAVSSMVERGRIANVMDELIAMGATDILVTKLENTRTT